MNRQAFLVPVSRRGFKKLTQHGQTWHIRRTDIDGTLLLESLEKTFKAGDEYQTDWRWAHIKDDPDFEVEIREV